MRTNLILRTYFEHVKESAPPITDADVQKYFDDHPQDFGPTPEVHARHLLVRADETAPDSVKAEARRKTEEALTRAKAGESFETLAKEYSQDPGSAEQGGDLGWFGPGRMVAPFDSASFALEPGQLSGVVQTQFGYHVIKVEEKRSSPGKNFDDVKDRIRQVLAQEQSQTQFKTTLSGLKEKAKLKIEPPSPALLDSLGT
jgi:peptidyl-prolyl cis-trans isomerase C